MIALAWQTMLLLGVAYLLGCWIACLLRRMIGGSATVLMPRQAIAVPAGASIPVSPAVAGETLQAPPPRAALPAAEPVRDAFRRADTLEPSPAPPPSVQAPVPRSPVAPVVPVASLPPARPDDATERFERALTEGRTVRSPATTDRSRSPDTAPAKPAQPAVPDQTLPASPRPPAEDKPPLRPATEIPPAKPDDLKRIRTIDQGLEAALRRLGIASFAQIGGWKPADVARMSQELGFKGRIEQENWIEQAQILAAGGETYYSSRLGRNDVVEAPPVSRETERQTPIPASPPRPPAAADTAPRAAVSTDAPVVVPSSAPSDVRFERALSAPAAPVAPVPPVAVPSRPAPAEQTEQRPAAEAVRPQRSAVEAAAAAAAALAAAAAAAKVSMASPPTAAEPTRPAAVSDNAAFAQVRPQAQPAAPAETQRPAVGVRDSLQRIGGITPEIEKLLNVQGISRYSQIAQWAAADIDKFDRLLGHSGRIQRENWIEQAQILARGGDTTFSRDFDRREGAAGAPARPVQPISRVQAPSAPMPAAPAQERPPTVIAELVPASPPELVPPADPSREREARGGDLSSLRSVRSEALRGAVAAGPGGGRSSATNDLKRIRGIGVLIEKRLNSMGVTSYEQIAEWTAADIERVSHTLDFKGRIERENWVEQARILSSGGQTEFSRRADRGEAG